MPGWSNSTNLFGPSDIIVGPTLGDGVNFTTLTAAMAAAVAGDTVYVRPKTGGYIENFSVKLGVNLVGLSSIGQGELVTIGGTINAPPGAGITVVQNIHGTVGGARGMECNGGAGSTMVFVDCSFDHTGNVLRWVSGNLVFNRCDLTSSAGTCIGADSVGGGVLTCEDCNIAGSTGAYVPTIAATALFKNSSLERTTAGPAINDSASGTITCFDCDVIGDIEQASGTLNFEYSECDSFFHTDDSTASVLHSSLQYIEIDDASIMTIDHCSLTDSGGNAVINVVGGAGAVVTATNLTLSSTAVPAVFVEAGDTLNYANFVFSGTTSALGGTGTFNVLDWKPYATTTTVGTASFAAADFAVSATGEVTSINPTVNTWTEVTVAGPTPMAVQNGYVANAGVQVNLTLPAVAVLGEVVKIDGKGAGLFQIQQAAGQTIHFLGSDTTTGAGGTLTATDQYGCLTLRCTVANLDFVVESSQGNFTVV